MKKKENGRKKANCKTKQKNPEKIRESWRKASQRYRKSHPEKIKSIKRKFNLVHKDSVRNDCSLYRQKNSEKYKLQSKQAAATYRLKNPDKIKLTQRKKYLKRKLADLCDMNKKSNFETNKRKATKNHTSQFSKNNNQVNQTNVSLSIKQFHKNITVGPEYICTCCDQLWYKCSVRKCNHTLYPSCPKDILNLSLSGVKSVNDTEWICSTCHSNLQSGRMPSCAKVNSMCFPELPKPLKNLSPLEERLISPRIPFMQVRELPSRGQLSNHGNVVNVPSDVSSTVNILPRTMDESATIPIKLKRRLSYKHHYQFQNVRPSKVLEAATFLVESSEIFQNEGIQVAGNYDESTLNTDREWSEFLGKSTLETSKQMSNDLNLNNNDANVEVTATEDDNDTDDEWCEQTEKPSGVMDTLLQQPDMSQDADKIISFAPGEGNRPIGVFMDNDAEYLSFPTIYCGKRRADNSERKAPVHYSTICKWELRSRDRRVAQSVPNIFFKLKKLQIKQIQGSASLSLRKCKTKGKTYTAGDLKSENSVNKLINLDEGFSVLRNLRGSPPYFERCKKDLFAMIRQLGKPTWFCSFSAAETRWNHLIKILGRLIDNKEYTDEDIKNMSWKQKSELIQKDPVTCARNFEHMVQLFIHTFLKSSSHPIGEIVDFFYRVEFQQRGSPHIHGLFWIKDAPEFGKDTEEDITKFVDTYVSCSAE